MTEPTPRITVYLVDDQAMLRAAFTAWMSDDAQIEVVGGSGDAREAITEIGVLRPRVILLDITMPGLSGLDAIPAIRRVHPSARILMMSNHEGESFVQQALKLGADGYLSKNSEPEELLLAIRSVDHGRPYISPKVAGSLVPHARSAAGSITTQGGIQSLTGREREVFLLLAVGKTNKEIAQGLKMSLGTAKKHRENLQRKLDCHSTAELARLAIREGLLAS